ncbi:MAG: glcD3 [Verrucomicrobiales bacterium]|nr:glcD3 [Verrucomicrobiales bacterium]
MTFPLPPLTSIPPEIAALTDYEPLARKHLGEQAWAYFAGGAADEITLTGNRSSFDGIRIVPRVLQDLRGGHTQVNLLGRTFAFPILVAPIAYHRMAHRDGEMATVLGASAMQAGMVVSTRASVPLEDLARNAVAPLWFQLYIQPDRGFTEALVHRAEDAGYEALVLTVDAPLNGIRNRMQRAGFRMPEGVEAVNLRGMAPPDLRPRTAGESVAFGPLLDGAPTWHDIAWLRSKTKLPVILKGILSPDDAALALKHGCAGIVVSNHGGRTLDTLPPAIEMLPEIADRVAGSMPILLDGGIRRGTDVFKAIALGAQAVLVGRPCIFGLAVAGAVGVAHVLNILRAEFEVAMALAGCATTRDIRPEHLRLSEAAMESGWRSVPAAATGAPRAGNGPG